MDEKRIALPEQSRVLLERLNEQAQTANALLSAGMEGVRTALGVPDGWVLLSPQEGFGPDPRRVKAPAPAQPATNGHKAASRQSRQPAE